MKKAPNAWQALTGSEKQQIKTEWQASTWKKGVYRGIFTKQSVKLYLILAFIGLFGLFMSIANTGDDLSYTLWLIGMAIFLLVFFLVIICEIHKAREFSIWLFKYHKISR